MKKEIIQFYYVANPSKEVRANVIQTLHTSSAIKKALPELHVVLTKYSDEINKLFYNLSPIYTGNRLTMSFFSLLKRQSRVWNYIEGSLSSIVLFILLLRDTSSRKVFYCREFIIAFWLSFLICPLLNGRLIYEAHGFETEEEGRAQDKWFQPILGFVEKYIFTHSSRIVCIADSAVKKMRAKGYMHERVRVSVIRNSFDSSVFFPRDKRQSRKTLHMDSDTIYFVYNGLTFKHRNVEQIVYAASKLSLTKSVRFLILGGQEDELKSICQLIKKLKVEDNVQALGKKDQSTAALYLSAADFLVIPGVLSWDVSSPLKLFEYMAVKKTIICPDIPSHREILTDKDVIFYKKDKLLEAFQKVLKIKKQDVLHYANNAYKISKKFSYEERAKKIIALMLEETK